MLRTATVRKQENKPSAALSAWRWKTNFSQSATTKTSALLLKVWRGIPGRRNARPDFDAALPSSHELQQSQPMFVSNRRRQQGELCVKAKLGTPGH
jgi:hypothetical protein